MRSAFWLAYVFLPLLVGATSPYDRTRGATGAISRGRSDVDSLVNYAGQHAAEAGSVRESQQMAAFFDDKVFSTLKESETILERLPSKKPAKQDKQEAKGPQGPGEGPKTLRETKETVTRLKEIKEMQEEDRRRLKEEKAVAEARAKQAKALAEARAKEAKALAEANTKEAKQAAKGPVKGLSLDEQALMIIQLARFQQPAPVPAPALPKLKKPVEINDIFGAEPAEIFLAHPDDPVPVARAKRSPPLPARKPPISLPPIHVTSVPVQAPASRDGQNYGWSVPTDTHTGAADRDGGAPPAADSSEGDAVESVETTAPALELKPKARLPPPAESPPDVIFPAKTVTVDVLRRPADSNWRLPLLACNVAFPALFAPYTPPLAHDTAPGRRSPMCAVEVDCAQRKRAARRLLGGDDVATGAVGSDHASPYHQPWRQMATLARQVAHVGRRLQQELMDDDSDGRARAHHVGRGGAGSSSSPPSLFMLAHPLMNVARNALRLLWPTRESTCEGTARACGALGKHVGLHLHEHSLGSCAVVAPSMADEGRHQVAPGAYARAAALIDGHNTVIRLEGPAAVTDDREWLLGAKTNVVLALTHLGEESATAENGSSYRLPDYFFINEAGGSDRAPVGHHESLPYVTLQALTSSAATTELYSLLASHVTTAAGAAPPGRPVPSPLFKLVVALLHSRLCTRLTLLGGFTEAAGGDEHGEHRHLGPLEEYVYELAAANHLMCYFP